MPTIAENRERIATLTASLQAGVALTNQDLSFLVCFLLCGNMGSDGQEPPG